MTANGPGNMSLVQRRERHPHATMKLDCPSSESEGAGKRQIPAWGRPQIVSGVMGESTRCALT